MTEHYATNTKIEDVINDPVFGDYGRLIFPVDSGYFGGSTLGNLSLTWYNYIDSDKTVEICNYMRNQAETGTPSFMRFIRKRKRLQIRRKEIRVCSSLREIPAQSSLS